MPTRPLRLADLPEIVPVFPLSGALLLPNTHRPLNIFEPRYVDMVDHVLAGNRLIGLIQPEEDGEESPSGEQVPLRQIGCLGRLNHFEDAEDGRYFIILDGVSRFELIEEVEMGTTFRQFRISAKRFASDFEPRHGEYGVDRSRFIKMMRDYALFADLDLDWDEIERTDTAELVNMCCMLSPYGAREKQVLLEAGSLIDRAETLIAMAEMEMARNREGATLQ